MGSRVRQGKHKLFELVVELRQPDVSNKHFSFCFPADYDDEELKKSIAGFSFPFARDFESPAVDHFTFVLTDIDGRFRFGFCRLSGQSETCFCLVSYYPWFEIFYRLLNYIAEVQGCDIDNDFLTLLSSLSSIDVSSPGTKVCVQNRNKTKTFTFVVPDSSLLPSIPDNRNLTEYYSAIDSYNMMIMFASMLFERRILVMSRKLSRLTACVHGAAGLFYPFHWQHLYIPVLPPHLIDYCSAPMPYLIGIHSSLFNQVAKPELGDVVILDADANTVSTPYEDLDSMPPKVVSFLKKELKAHKKNKTATPCVLMGTKVSTAFLQTLVRLLASYRGAITKSNGKLTFNREAFVESRSQSMQPFLERLLHVQAFEQFVNERLEIFQENPDYVDDFESEIIVFKVYEEQNKGKHKGWTKYDKTLTDFANKVKVTSINTLKTVKTTLNDLYEADFSLAKRNNADVAFKIVVTPAITDGISEKDENLDPKHRAPMLREMKRQPSGNGNAHDRNKCRTFRLSNDDSEVLDVLLQTSHPLLSDKEMEKMFRKYSCDNLLDSCASLSNSSDMSRDNLSMAPDNLSLNYESLKFFGTRESTTAIGSRMANSTPNMVESASSCSNSTDYDVSDIAIGAQVAANPEQDDVVILSGSSGGGGMTVTFKIDESMQGESPDSIKGYQLRGKSVYPDYRRQNCYSIRNLPNIREIIQRYENTDSSPEANSPSKPVSRVNHSSESSDSVVARQAARYMTLDRNAKLDSFPDAKGQTWSRTADARGPEKIEPPRTSSFK